MNTLSASYMLVGLLCLISVVTSVFSVPTVSPGASSLGSTELEDSAFATEVPSAGNELSTTEDADKPVAPDNDDMETAEVLVFRPLFSYQRVRAARRRRLEEARRQRPYYTYYPYSL